MTDLDPISADWLALREPADDRARAAAADTMLLRLEESLAAGTATGTGGADERPVSAARPTPTVLCVDLGTGTGANPRWLMPRLPFEQRWVLVDHDDDLLGRLREGLADRVPPWKPVVADVAHLAAVIDDHRQPDEAVLVTCAALLDLLDAATVDELARTLAATGAHGLFSLTVDGGWNLDPTDPLDGAMRAAFNDHQRRFGHLGPEAVPALRDALGGHDVTVETVSTDWRLDTDDAHDRSLAVRLLQDRSMAVQDQVARSPRAGLTDTDVAGWLESRTAHAREGDLRMRVGHVDVLVLPRR